MAKLYGPPSDGSIIPHGLGDALREQFVDYSTINSQTQVTRFDQFPTALSGAYGYNAAAIAQDMIATGSNGKTYSVFWDALGHPIVAEFSATSLSYTTFDLSRLNGNPLAAPVLADSHNNIVLGIDGDGYIHISGNHHNHTLRYVRSARPFDITEWETPDMIGTEEDRVTYPQFLRVGADLLFFYRNGESGNGDHYINRYSTVARSWTRVAQVFKGTAPVTPDESAYINKVARDPSTGRLHLFYLWRTSADATTCHDISYVYSDDDGATWNNLAGAAQALPIEPSNTSTIVLAGSPAGLVNQTGASVDSNGVPHAFWWLNGAADAKELHHFYPSAGAWRDEVVLTTSATVSRPASFSTTDGKTFAVYGKSGIPTALQVSPIAGEEVTLYPYSQGGWEPTFEGSGPSGVMRLMLAGTASTHTYGGVLTVRMGQIDDLITGQVVAVRPSPAPAPVPVFTPGAPIMEAGRYYVPEGPRTVSAAAYGMGEFRGAYFTAGATAFVTSLSVDVITAGTAGSMGRFVCYTPRGEFVYQSSEFDVSTVGIKTVSTRVYLVHGQTLVIGVVCFGGAGNGPSYRWLEGKFDGRIGGGSPNTALNNTPAGLSAAGLTLPLGDNVTLNGTSRVPLVAVGVWSG